MSRSRRGSGKFLPHHDEQYVKPTSTRKRQPCGVLRDASSARRRVTFPHVDGNSSSTPAHARNARKKNKKAIIRLSLYIDTPITIGLRFLLSDA
ncbi:hypothetical protein CABS02_13816 [Colletotrichum abscissum]|uniref:Uncharacterized protein n=1 Tax=Colletotrichum abscissum TaxID=1671311 RepID=A0A9Q0AWP1_9PEZI|nr:hypothetical protein CABS02_13816 [Colletotrichum abscissum]